MLLQLGKLNDTVETSSATVSLLEAKNEFKIPIMRVEFSLEQCN